MEIIKGTSTMIITNSNDISTTTDKMIVKFPHAKVFKEGTYVALSSLIINYAWNNLATVYNNLTFSYWINGVEFPITFTPGNYSVAQMQEYLQLKMRENNHFCKDSNGNYVYFIRFVANPVYYAISLVLYKVTLGHGYPNPATSIESMTDNGYVPQVTIANNGFKDILGFTPGIYPATATHSTEYSRNSDVAPQVAPVTSVMLHCSLVGGQAGFNAYPDVIKVFTPSDTTPYGGQIVIDANGNYDWFKVSTGTYEQIVLSFTDQNNTPLDLLDSNNNIITLKFIQ